jgi:ankyrin repeat protein
MRNLLIALLITGAFLSRSGVAGVYDDIIAAANNNQTETVIGLLERGLDVNTADRDGTTLLGIAARTGNLELVDYLLRSRAGTFKRNRYGDNALLLATSQGHAKIVTRLLDFGAELNPEKGWAPLHYAILTGKYELVRLLLSKGAKTELRAPNGRTAIMLAAMNGNTEAAMVLIQVGADLAAKDYDGKTASEIALSKGFAPLAEQLKPAAN